MLLIEYCNCCEQTNFNGAPQNHYGDPGGIIYREHICGFYIINNTHICGVLIGVVLLII